MKTFVFGAGGHGKVVCDILLAAKTHVDGFFDDGAKSSVVLGLPVLTGDRMREALEAGNGVQIALGIGDNASRARVVARCRALGARILTAIHPRAILSPSAELGEGTVVMAGAIVNPDARIGEGVILNTGSIVEHDSVVGAYAHVCPNATMGGTTKLGAFALLGTGAVLLPGICVGDGTVVGGGALIREDLPPGVVAHGVPARIRRTLGKT